MLVHERSSRRSERHEDWEASVYRIVSNGPGHVERNKLCWDESYTLGLSKQRKVVLDWYEFLCFGSATALFASEHNLFGTMRPDRAKSLLQQGASFAIVNRLCTWRPRPPTSFWSSYFSGGSPYLERRTDWYSTLCPPGSDLVIPRYLYIYSLFPLLCM